MRMLLPLALLSGCGLAFNYTKLNPPPRTLYQKKPADVELRTIAPAGRDFVEVGYFDLDEPNLIEGETSPKVMPQIRKEGAEQGCDALVVAGPTFVHLGVGSYNRYRATCIVYR